jgi:hypothetical protein
LAGNDVHKRERETTGTLSRSAQGEREREETRNPHSRTSQPAARGRCCSSENNVPTQLCTCDGEIKAQHGHISSSNTMIIWPSTRPPDKSGHCKMNRITDRPGPCLTRLGPVGPATRKMILKDGNITHRVWCSDRVSARRQIPYQSRGPCPTDSGIRTRILKIKKIN